VDIYIYIYMRSLVSEAIFHGIYNQQGIPCNTIKLALSCLNMGDESWGNPEDPGDPGPELCDS